MADAMLGTFFAIDVRSEHRQAFLDASIFAAQSFISEEREVFHFQIMVDAVDPNRFYFYNVFRDEAAVQAHEETSVFKTWWQKVQPMLASETETIAKMHTLFPSAKGFEAQKMGLLQW
ncbi:Quinol monooxygenase YgiN [Cribrihabitans marinus]|uniref:Quinol monooxygenase YgiN n=1 Tax=Cribrihabitans marinus TaxID=1227549 RepID=A0A1H6TYB3_9RHOB|nr:antibiotic biosynthesis monooxygenase [Cribrihabitans marinus]GGH21157.1 hypothetical protein GCM10010973_05570 [Cribrihabitans marinus]SEI85001.1 Quinol monooxygenase YgiN [Cribrihabitans marinus]